MMKAGGHDLYSQA